MLSAVLVTTALISHTLLSFAAPVHNDPHSTNHPPSSFTNHPHVTDHYHELGQSIANQYLQSHSDTDQFLQELAKEHLAGHRSFPIEVDSRSPSPSPRHQPQYEVNHHKAHSEESVHHDHDLLKDYHYDPHVKIEPVYAVSSSEPSPVSSPRRQGEAHDSSHSTSPHNLPPFPKSLSWEQFRMEATHDPLPSHIEHTEHFQDHHGHPSNLYSAAHPHTAHPHMVEAYKPLAHKTLDHFQQIKPLHQVEGMPDTFQVLPHLDFHAWNREKNKREPSRDWLAASPQSFKNSVKSFVDRRNIRLAASRKDSTSPNNHSPVSPVTPKIDSNQVKHLQHTHTHNAERFDHGFLMNSPTNSPPPGFPHQLYKVDSVPHEQHHQAITREQIQEAHPSSLATRTRRGKAKMHANH